MLFLGVDAFDIELACSDPEKFIDMVVALEPTFGGINIEDVKVNWKEEKKRKERAKRKRKEKREKEKKISKRNETGKNKKNKEKPKKSQKKKFSSIYLF